MRVFSLTFFSFLLLNQVYASKARVQSLGQDAQDGSFYILDSRSVFYNPAHLNDISNFMIMEIGSQDAASDSVSSPRPEAGFFKTLGNTNFGLYLSNDHDLNDRASCSSSGGQGGCYRGNATDDTAVDFLSPDNRWELFIAGGGDFKWGTKLYFTRAKTNGNDSGERYTETYNGSERRVERKQFGYGLDWGFLFNKFEGHVRFDLHDKAEGADNNGDVFEADLGGKIGGSYKLGDFTLAGEYQQYGFEATLVDNDNDGNISGDGDDLNYNARNSHTKYWWLGTGFQKDFSNKGRLFSDLKYTRSITENSYAVLKTTTTFAHNNASRPTKNTSETIPFSIGYETDATSWLTVRGSVVQNLWSSQLSKDSVRKTISNSATLRAGVTVNFGQLRFDGMVANETNGDGAGATDSADGVARLDSLMSRVSMHYWF